MAPLPEWYKIWGCLSINLYCSTVRVSPREGLIPSFKKKKTGKEHTKQQECLLFFSELLNATNNTKAFILDIWVANKSKISTSSRKYGRLLEGAPSLENMFFLSGEAPGAFTRTFMRFVRVVDVYDFFSRVFISTGEWKARGVSLVRFPSHKHRILYDLLAVPLKNAHK
jgi:hypothetical protein